MSANKWPDILLNLLGQDERERGAFLDLLVRVSAANDLCLVDRFANLRLFIIGERDVGGSHVLVQVLDLLSASYCQPVYSTQNDTERRAMEKKTMLTQG